MIDGAMTEVIRPALYDAYHYIDLTEPTQSLDGDQWHSYVIFILVFFFFLSSYIVVDGAMTEVIRPALYDAYHYIDLAEPTQSLDGDQWHSYVIFIFVFPSFSPVT